MIILFWRTEGVANPPLGEGIANPPSGEGMMNPQYDERRLNEAIATLDEKYEDKYNLLQLEIQQNNKGKISRVDSLLNRSSPFTERVMAIQVPKKFKFWPSRLIPKLKIPPSILTTIRCRWIYRGLLRRWHAEPFHLPCLVQLGIGSENSLRVPSRVLMISDGNS